MSIGNDQKQPAHESVPSQDLTNHVPPTEQELHDLVHVADSIPIEAWLVMLVGSAERLVFYGASTCLQNYLQYSRRDVIPGVLGLGQAGATAIKYAFMVLVNFAPVPMAIVADGLAFPVVWLCWGQTYNNLISQAGQMETYGIPNDVMPTFNPIACIIAGPVIQQWLFPLLNRCKIPFRPIARMQDVHDFG
ncbi:hypothetical protein KCU95_g18107, partial [Aureobasidium melanogenum]